MKPLAERFRPTSFEEVAGQEHLVGTRGFLSHLVSQNSPLSLIFWGPPGSGKTTLAKLYAKAFQAKFISLSAVSSGASELKKIIHEAESFPLFQQKTILFIDEIHRFNKAQQDIFLPYVEKGVIILIGATTENPSFSVNNALLSRTRVLEVKALDEKALKKILSRYEQKCGSLPLTEESRDFLIESSAGDGRYLFNLIENLSFLPKEPKIGTKELSEFLQKRAPLYDKAGEGHFNLISALHKAVRGSDPDAALYWFSRMLEGGEDPNYLARRIVRMAIEDIGLADPEALKISLNAGEAYQRLGSPEGELALAEAVVYLSLAPKSNAVYTAYKEARALASKTTEISPPKIILNAPTRLMKEKGYGKGYLYDHEEDEAFSGQNYFPEGMERQEFYFPVERGFERELKKRSDYFKELRKKKILEK